MTAEDLIKQSLRDLGVIASGDDPNADELSDCFVILNQLLANLSAGAAFIPSIVFESFPLTGAGEYTIGDGADFDTAAPFAIKAATVTHTNGATHDADIVDATRWAAFPDRSAEGLFAQILYYDPGLAGEGTIRLAPKPTAGELELYSYKELAAIDDVTDDITLPPRYDKALRTLLAVDLAPEFGRSVSPELAAAAQKAEGIIAALNVGVLGPPRPVAPAPALPEAA